MQWDGMTPQEPAPAIGAAIDTDTAIDTALAGTASLDRIALAEHVVRFDAVHVALNEALSRIDTD